MNEFTLCKIQGSKDSLTRRLTFAQTREFKIGMVIYFSFYLLATFADDFGYDWFVVPGFIIALIAFVLAFIPFSSSKNTGKVKLGEHEIEIIPKIEDDYFPDSPIRLNNLTELEINTVQSIRWWSSFVILQFEAKQGDDEQSFGLTIKSREEEKQYLRVLESWYKTGYPVREYDVQGSRVFKLDQGKNYEQIQKIKKEYGLEW